MYYHIIAATLLFKQQHEDFILLTIQIAHHLEDIAQIQSKLTALRETSSKHAKLLEEQVSQKSEALKKLEVKLATQADYDVIKEELRLDVLYMPYAI